MMANWVIENMERQQNTGLVTKVNWTVTLVKDMEFSNTNGVVELEASNSFIPLDIIFPYHVKTKMISTNKYQYTVTRYSAIYDRIADQIIFDIKDKGVAKDITLQTTNDKYE